MNIIFLDIDGVLNTGRYQDFQEFKYGKSTFNHQFKFDPICMENLKEVAYEFDAYIVISSSWRIEREEIYYIELLGNLASYDLHNRVLGKTPSFSTIRGEEIKQWIIENNNKIDNFVILDDEDDMAELVDHLALCNDYYGFDDNVKVVAKNILNLKE